MCLFICVSLKYISIIFVTTLIIMRSNFDYAVCFWIAELFDIHQKCIIFWYLFSVPFPWHHQVRKPIWTIFSLQVNYLLCLLFKSRICFYIFVAPSNPENGQDGLVPVVMWHGMGDSCCLPFSMGRIKRVIFL